MRILPIVLYILIGTLATSYHDARWQGLTNAMTAGFNIAVAPASEDMIASTGGLRICNEPGIGRAGRPLAIDITGSIRDTSRFVGNLCVRHIVRAKAMRVYTTANLSWQWLNGKELPPASFSSYGKRYIVPYISLSGVAIVKHSASVTMIELPCRDQRYTVAIIDGNAPGDIYELVATALSESSAGSVDQIENLRPIDIRIPRFDMSYKRAVQLNGRKGSNATSEAQIRLDESGLGQHIDWPPKQHIIPVFRRGNRQPLHVSINRPFSVFVLRNDIKRVVLYAYINHVTLR